ncbi:MAG: hypothetical protein JNM25_07025 [Planctomycetes bacterium]|nr:hypothetical protein [Planctomycetota bacterium]
MPLAPSIPRPDPAPRRSLRTLAFLGFVAAAGAQQPEPAAPPAPDAAPAAAVRTLCLQNLAPNARAEGAAVVVPFAEGAVPDRPDLHVRDTATAWQPFGARWPDGSLRQALCLFRAELAPLQERALDLVPGPGPELPTGDVDLPPAQIEFVVTQGGTTTRAEPVPVAELEANALRRVQLRRVRIGTTGLVGELIVTAWRDQPHAAIDVAVFCSDPSTPRMQCGVDEVAVESRGMAIVLRHPGRLGVRQQTTAQGSRNVLLQNTQIGDGQGIRRTGALVPPLHGDGGLADSTSLAACVAPVLGATSWRDSGAFGPFGHVPEMPPWLRGPQLRAHFARRHRAFVDSERPGGDPFAVGNHGLDRMAGQTGDQGDFGTVKLSTVAASGLPSFLLEVEAAMLQEGCRPVHCFEADGSPVEPADHPQWVVWSGRTHWHPGVSPDRLGKDTSLPAFDNHGWTGKDREHWSSNFLGAFAQLTGAHWARLELANEVRLYLAGQTTDPRLTTSGSGAARGAGRTELAAAWMWLATGDERLRQRMNERLELVYYPQWAGRELGQDRVRTLSVCLPDDRLLQGKFSYWNPWQDAIAAVGFGAAFGVTGNPRARELAEQVALNVVRYGWLLTPTECEIAIAMRWQDGVPLTEEQRMSGDPTVLHWAYGTAYSEWSVAACEIARVAALARGDEALAQRAATIQERLRARRRQPPAGPWDFGGIDRLTEWDAVRWTSPKRD